MILKNVAVRHGRRVLASPISRSALRQLSTTSTSTDPVSTRTKSAVSLDLQSQKNANNVSSTKKKQKAIQELIMSLGMDSAHEHRTPSWTQATRVGRDGQPITPAQQFAEFQHVQKNTKSIGTRVERRYVPTELISNPPAPEDVTLELLMSAQTHMGHNTSSWNPANSRYIYGSRQGIHIISLETTAAHLRRAARVVEEVTYHGGLVLFVGTRKGQMEIVTRASELAGACHLFTKWTPGAITNRDVILRSQGLKVVNQMDKDLDEFDGFKSTSRPLMPDLVVCLNPLENYVLLYECGLKDIPTIGVIDTDADPTWVTYTIPANDDSLRSTAVIAGVLGRAGQAGQKRRLADASRGEVPWNTHPDLQRHMKKEIKAAIVKRKEVMGKMQTNLTGFTEDEQKLLQAKYGDTEFSVSEDEMVSMLEEAAMGDAEAASTEASVSETEPVSTPQVGEIEAQLKKVQDAAVEIETVIKGRGKGQ